MAVLTTNEMDDVTITTETTTEEHKQLYNSVLETSRFFTSLVELLPAKFYLSQKDEEEENIFNPKRMKKRKKKPPADKKFLAKKAKLFKLDPSQHKTITELQEEVEKKEKELITTAAVTMTTAKIQPISVPQVPSTQSLSDLHEKLHAKMNQLRGNRKVGIPKTNNNHKNNENNENNENNRKRKLKEKKQQEMERKKKEKESTNIKISNAIETKALNNNNNNNKEGTTNGDLVFSKFDFATRGEPKAKKKKKKDLKQLLNEAESKESTLKLLEETDAEKAKETKAAMSWDSALERAKGTKVKDNPKLLKKTLKRKEKERTKSDKKWKERTDTVEKKMEEKQKLRKQHLKERREVGKSHGKKSSAKKKKKPPKKFSPGF